jgi:hypothetical protein
MCKFLCAPLLSLFLPNVVTNRMNRILNNKFFDKIHNFFVEIIPFHMNEILLKKLCRLVQDLLIGSHIRGGQRLCHKRAKTCVTIAWHRLFEKLIKSKSMEMAIEHDYFVIIFAIPLSSDIKCREFDEK